jgi:hypothetical protein
MTMLLGAALGLTAQKLKPLGLNLLVGSAQRA